MAEVVSDIRYENMRAAAAAGDLKRAGDILQTALQDDPDCGWAYVETVELLLQAGRREEADRILRRALTRLPDDGRLHGQYGQVLCERNELKAGEWHLRRALELGQRTSSLLTQLGLNLVGQGRPAEAEACYEEAHRLAPRDVHTLAAWSKACEVQHDLPRALQLVEQAAAVGTPRDVDMLHANHLVRTGRVPEALAVLDAVPAEFILGDAQLERGRLRDRAGRHADAWADWSEGKKKLAAEAGVRPYDATEIDDFFGHLVKYITRARFARLPRAKRRAEVPQPLFVLGFPRSGTTLVEQVLAAHSQVRPGGELPFVGKWPELVDQLLPSREPFPLNLSMAMLADRRHVVTLLRDYYLARAESHGLLDPGCAYFVDKMPFNEMWLPLIRVAFPEAAIVHMVRHPLDVCVSILSHQLTHGFQCGYRLQDIASHLAAVHRLHTHYRRELDARELVVKYESLVADPHAVITRLLHHCDLPFDEACLRFHESGRYAPTPSYAQVAEPINDRSIGRHRHYVAELQPVHALLAPLVKDWESLD